MRRPLAAALLLSALLAVGSGVRFGLPARAQSEPVTVRLVERNDSGVSGEAKLVPADGATWVYIRIDGAGVDHLAYLHRGTCENGRDAQAIPLAVASPGVRSATAVDLPLDELLSAGYVIALHRIDTDLDDLLDPGSSAACGEIGALPGDTDGAAATIEAPDAGVGPPRSGRGWMVSVAALAGVASAAIGLACRRAEPRPADAREMVNAVARHRLRGMTK